MQNFIPLSDRLRRAGIKTIRTRTSKDMVEVVYLCRNGVIIRRPSYDRVVDVCASEFGVHI